MNIAVILAAGSGSRMNIDTPKQFLLLNKRPLFAISLETFSSHKSIDEIILVTSKNEVQTMNEYVKKNGFNKVNAVVEGGSTRQESTFNALQYLKDKGINDDDVILIHDAARPLVSQDIITNNIEGCLEHDAVETAVKAVDTLIESKDGTLNAVLNRDVIYQVQTPQTFRFKLIYEAHKAFNNETNTDDAGIVLKYNHPVHIVEGDKLNFKVTTQDDLKLLKALLKDER